VASHQVSEKGEGAVKYEDMPGIKNDIRRAMGRNYECQTLKSLPNAPITGM